MEDALVHYEQGVYCRLCWRVLILVLMEDALVLKYVTSRLRYSFGLNPCFNGRCTRTMEENGKKKSSLSLNPCFNGRCTRTLWVEVSKGKGFGMS